MSDPRLEQLLRAAHEAEAFEHDVLGAASASMPPRLRLTEASPEERAALLRSMQPSGAEVRRERFAGWGWRAGFAAAACVMVGWFISASLNTATSPAVPKAPSGVGSLASAGAAARDNAPVRFRPAFEGLRPRSVEPVFSLASAMPTGEDDACVVVAIFRDSRGGCPCIHMQPHTLARGQSLDDLSPEQLADIRLKGSCASTGDSLLLVALQGPGDQLPSTAAQIEALADCVGDAPRACDGSPGCMASMARGCLPSSVKVLAHSVEMASR